MNKTTQWHTKWTERLSYGLSDAADNLVFQVMTSYLLYFYTDVFRLSAGEVALLFVIARLADVVESLLIGVLIDRTHSRFGKSRPFFLWYAAPYVISAILTFMVIPGSHTIRLLWAYLTYLALGFFYTAVNLPITSVLPTMTNNSTEITLLGVIRQLCGSSVQVIVAVCTLPLVNLIGKGNEQLGFLGMMIVYGLISLILILNTFIHIRERFHHESINHQSFRQVFIMLRHNRPWLLLSLVIFLYWLVVALKNQTAIYYFTYVINQQRLIAFANMFTLTSLIGVMLILFFTTYWTKRKTMQIGIIIAIGGQLILAGGVYEKQLPILYTGLAVNALGHGLIVGLISIMIADTVRYGIHLGSQAEGILASTDDLGVNLGLGVGGLITAGLFQLSGYVPNHIQNSATLHMINLNFVWLPFIGYFMMLIILYFYHDPD